jgi:hypothetical protein
MGEHVDEEIADLGEDIPPGRHPTRGLGQHRRPSTLEVVDESRLDDGDGIVVGVHATTIVRLAVDADPSFEGFGVDDLSGSCCIRGSTARCGALVVL